MMRGPLFLAELYLVPLEVREGLSNKIWNCHLTLPALHSVIQGSIEQKCLTVSRIVFTAHLYIKKMTNNPETDILERFITYPTEETVETTSRLKNALLIVPSIFFLS